MMRAMCGVQLKDGNFFYFLVLFLRRAHCPDCPPLDSSQLPTDYETRALTNAPPGTLMEKEPWTL